MAKYYSMVTDRGLALYTNAGLLGKKVSITEFAVGDGGGEYYQPEPSMRALRHEVWRGPVTEYELDAESDHTVNIHGVIPAQTGGFTIREMAAFDSEGNMVAVANLPDYFKPTMEDGISSDMELCISVAMEHPEYGESGADPNTVIVSRRYLEKVMFKTVIMAEGEEIPVGERRANTMYLKVTDIQAVRVNDQIRLGPGLLAQVVE